MKEYKYNDETFFLDYTEECGIVITYHDQIGDVRVDPQGTKDRPYTYRDRNNSTFKFTAKSENEAVDRCCRMLLGAHERAESHKEFNPEDACHDLHEWFDKL